MRSASAIPPRRDAHCREELARPVIRLAELRLLARDGVPDTPADLRAVVWKLLLGYLPPEQAEWPRALARKRGDYAGYCADILIDPKRGDASGSPAAAAPPEGPPPAREGADASAASPEAAGPSGRAEADLLRRSTPLTDHPLSLGHVRRGAG